MACSKEDNLTITDSEKPQMEQSVFQQHLENNTQRIIAEDLGAGTYYVTGVQGTIIDINDALMAVPYRLEGLP